MLPRLKRNPWDFHSSEATDAAGWLGATSLVKRTYLLAVGERLSWSSGEQEDAALTGHG